jgi:hypothetical protein
MTTYTPRLNLPLIEATQAQKHVTHNEALERLDIMVQLRVQQFEATSPVNGQSWALGSTPTGVWAGHGGQIASYVGDGWYYIAAGTGWRAWGLAEGALRVWNGSGWNPVGLDASNLNNLPGVGIGAASDPVNRLTVSAPCYAAESRGRRASGQG